MSKKYTFGQIRTFDRAKAEETRTIPFVFSTFSRDRHGTILNQDNWNLDAFELNGIAGYMHNVYGGDMCNAPDPNDVIGKTKAWVEQIDGRNALVGEITFEPADINPKADTIFKKLLFGSLSMTSVGFSEVGKGHWGEGDEAQRGANPTYYFEGQELLEISVVNIPSNRDAAVRSMRDQAANAIMYVKRELGNDFSFSDIENMRVADVIKLLEMSPDQRQAVSPLEKGAGGIDKNPDTKLKNQRRARAAASGIFIKS